MKLTCGIVMDLLPLYEEGICSEETRQAVEEHLKECHTCRSFLEDVSSFSKEDIVEKTENIMEEDKVAIKGFINRVWIFGREEIGRLWKKAYDSFLESTELLREAGGIQRAEYKGVVSSENSEGFEYDLKYDLFVDGIRYRTSFRVSDNGVSRFRTGNSPEDEPIAHLGVWDEWFWQDLNGCYYDFETYKYVYY